MKHLLTLFTAFLLLMTLTLTPVLAESADTVPTSEPTEELNWFQSIAANLSEIPWSSALVVIALIAVLAILSVSSKQGWTSREIAFAAMCIAISFVLSNIRLFRMPQGGSITPASKLPLILFALACGPIKGVVLGCAYGLLNLLLDPYIIHPIQMLVDYPMASAAVALCCLANCLPTKNERVRLVIAVTLGYLGGYVMAVLSGVVFFAEYAGEQNALIYSLSYNFSFTFGEMLICMLIVCCVPGMSRLTKRIRKS